MTNIILGKGVSSMSAKKPDGTFVSVKDKDPQKKFGGVVELISDMEYQKLQFRFNPRRHTPRRSPTGIEALDTIFGGGLPVGLTTFYGGAGSGKSLMAREISKNHKTIYVACEVLGDAPDNKEFPNVTTVDYTTYLPSPERALRELFSIIDRRKPELVIVDSMTTFFSKSRKALPESDVREMVSLLHVACDGEIPIIGISEIRGTGFNESPAGGQGVLHGCSMLVRFNTNLIKYQGQKEMYNKNYGDMCYTMRVEKDKNNMANIYEHEVSLDENRKYVFNRVFENQQPSAAGAAKNGKKNQ
jgi:predicted ATP-dependent serine protease